MSESNTSCEATPRFREAFERLALEIRAVPASEFVPITIDVQTAVATTLSVLPGIRALRTALIELPGFDMARFDRLEDYALALGHAHGVYLTASAPPRALEQLGAEGAALRDTLLSDAAALGKRGLIDSDRLNEIGSRIGYRNVAFDLLAIVSVFRERWSAVSGKTAVSQDELQRGEVLADRLITAVGAREQAPLTLIKVSADRQRAFTLFIKAYDAVRRAFTYLRWDEGDVDDIVPSLYAGRNKRRRDEQPSRNEPSVRSHDSGSHPSEDGGSAPIGGNLPKDGPFSN